MWLWSGARARSSGWLTRRAVDAPYEQQFAVVANSYDAAVDFRESAIGFVVVIILFLVYSKFTYLRVTDAFML